MGRDFVLWLVEALVGVLLGISTALSTGVFTILRGMNGGGVTAGLVTPGLVVIVEIDMLGL